MMVIPFESRVTTSALTWSNTIYGVGLAFRSQIWSTTIHLSERVMMVSPIEWRVTTSALTWSNRVHGVGYSV